MNIFKDIKTQRILKNNHEYINKYFAFTLAEVLIVIGVIGVVAALTIPVLINTTSDLEYKSALKENYAVFSQVYARIAADNDGSFKNALSACSASQDHTCFKNILKSYLRYSSECDSGATSGKCFPSSVYDPDKSAAEADTYLLNPAGLILADGTYVDIYLDYNSGFCNTTRGVFTNECGWITIDVNGMKKPNTWGKDIYSFMFYADKFRPVGSKGDCLGFACVAEGDGTYTHSCDSTYAYGCAGKYLYQ